MKNNLGLILIALAFAGCSKKAAEEAISDATGFGITLPSDLEGKAFATGCVSDDGPPNTRTIQFVNGTMSVISSYYLAADCSSGSPDIVGVTAYLTSAYEETADGILVTAVQGLSVATPMNPAAAAGLNNLHTIDSNEPDPTHFCKISDWTATESVDITGYVKGMGDPPCFDSYAAGTTVYGLFKLNGTGQLNLDGFKDSSSGLSVDTDNDLDPIEL